MCDRNTITEVALWNKRLLPPWLGLTYPEDLSRMYEPRQPKQLCRDDECEVQLLKGDMNDGKED